MLALLNLLGVAIDINWERFLGSFKYMGQGMLGIFIVITILIVGIALLNKATSPKNNNDSQEEDE